MSKARCLISQSNACVHLACFFCRENDSNDKVSQPNCEVFHVVTPPHVADCSFQQALHIVHCLANARVRFFPQKRELTLCILFHG